MKNNLVNRVWSKEKYYEIASKGSSEVKHPSMKKLKELANSSKNILDMGCGEGTRLSNISNKNNNAYGIDISKKAIEIAKNKYPKFHFTVGNLENLPFPDNKFDLVYSAFVVEHLENPKKVIKEGVRVLKDGSSLLITAPNFGAPNRASPPYKGNRINKLIKGFIEDFKLSSNLSWNKVNPIANENNYLPDWDTTIEPYIGSLIIYLKNLGLKITYSSSLWEMEEKNASTMQKIFKSLGKANIYPFTNWGPHLLVVAEK